MSDVRPRCCDKPDPAVLEKNGRQFCRNCKKYLDKAPSRDVIDVAPVHKER